MARCLDAMQKGKIDAALETSYTNDRVIYMDFPPDAGPKETKTCSSQFKIYCTGCVVITLKSNKFEYK